jgi:hypothetical protein
MNMSNVRRETVEHTLTVPIRLARDGMSIKSTHSGDKTYYAVDVTGTILPITTKAFYVPDFITIFLLAGRALITSKFRIQMGEDQLISGKFPSCEQGNRSDSGIPVR